MPTATPPPPDAADFPNRMAEILSGVDVVDLDARVVHETVRLAEKATQADLGRPTPCTEWTLHVLLEHMTAQNLGFAAASEGEADPAAWKPSELGPEPVSAYLSSAERLITAFSAEGVVDRSFPLPEFGPGAAFPGRLAIGFHFIDYAVHAWDVGRSLDLTVEFGPEVLEPAYQIAHAMPGGDLRLAPGAPFGPAVPWSEDERELDAIVALLGRSPTWPN